MAHNIWPTMQIPDHRQVADWNANRCWASCNSNKTKRADYGALAAIDVIGDIKFVKRGNSRFHRNGEQPCCDSNGTCRVFAPLAGWHLCLLEGLRVRHPSGMPE